MLIALLGCVIDPSWTQPPRRGPAETPPLLDIVCYGTFQEDAGNDGVVDEEGELVITEHWTERVSRTVVASDDGADDGWGDGWDDGADVGDEERWLWEYDPRGLLVLEHFESTTGLEFTTSWRWDPDGRLLAEVRDHDLWGWSKRFLWDGPQLDRIETDYDEDGAPDRLTTYSYGPDGRLVEQVSQEAFTGWAPSTTTYTWLAPAPSLDFQWSEDVLSDGTVDRRAEVLYDEAGAMIESRQIWRDFGFASRWSRELDAAGDEVYSEYDVTWSDGSVYFSETTTTRDADGRPLEIATWTYDDAEVHEDRETWTWSCL